MVDEKYKSYFGYVKFCLSFSVSICFLRFTYINAKPEYVQCMNEPFMLPAMCIVLFGICFWFGCQRPARLKL